MTLLALGYAALTFAVPGNAVAVAPLFGAG